MLEIRHLGRLAFCCRHEYVCKRKTVVRIMMLSPGESLPFGRSTRQPETRLSGFLQI